MLLNILLAVKRIDIAMITETWLSDSISSAELSLNGKFEVFRKDRNGIGGGVLILIRATIPCSAVDILDSSVEITAADICFGNCKLRFMYVPVFLTPQID